MNRKERRALAKAKCDRRKAVQILRNQAQMAGAGKLSARMGSSSKGGPKAEAKGSVTIQAIMDA